MNDQTDSRMILLNSVDEIYLPGGITQSVVAFTNLPLKLKFLIPLISISSSLRSFLKFRNCCWSQEELVPVYYNKTIAQYHTFNNLKNPRCFFRLTIKEMLLCIDPTVSRYTCPFSTIISLDFFFW